METAIKNNIQVHFFKRQYKYIKQIYKGEKKTKKELHEIQNELNNGEIPFVGKDLLNCIPQDIEKSLAYDLQAYPEKFLLPMWKMNRYYESIEKKTFSILPLRRGFIPRSIHIDTETLKKFMREDEGIKDNEKFKPDKEIFNLESSDKKRKRGRDRSIEAMEYKDLLWKNYIDMNKILQSKQYRFAHYIVTDGISVSILQTKINKPKKQGRGKKIL